MPKSVVATRGGAAALAAWMEDELRALGLGPGDKLPTEREWSRRSGRGRTTVRQALAVLEEQGRITRHVGRGTFLVPSTEPDEEHLAAVRSSSPAEIMAVRLLVEPASMPLVVSAARGPDFVEMERCLDAAEHTRGYEAFEKWDAAFHRSLALATHNTLLVQICDMTNAARHQPLWGQLKRRSFTPERRRQYMSDHQSIAEALIDRDAGAAQQAMRAHLLRVRANILGEGP